MVGLQYVFEKQEGMNTTLIFDLVYSICRKKIETTAFYLNPVMEIELCTCLSFLKPVFHFLSMFTTFRKLNLLNMFKIQKII